LRRLKNLKETKLSSSGVVVGEVGFGGGRDCSIFSTSSSRRDWREWVEEQSREMEWREVRRYTI